MKRFCPNCRASTSDARCPVCGTPTDPDDDEASAPEGAYTIFDHAQKGPTPTVGLQRNRVGAFDLTDVAPGDTVTAKTDAGYASGVVTSVHESDQHVLFRTAGGRYMCVSLHRIAQVARHLTD